MKSSFFSSCLIGVGVLLLLFQQAVASELDYSPYPQPDAGYVSDHANLLSADEETQLERWLLQVEEESTVEIIVVTIDSISEYRGTDNRSIEQFAAALFNTYGIGNMPKNDGILLLISTNDRKARIELGKHYGYTRDNDATRIMQNVIIPKFKAGEYPSGIIDGTEAIIEEFTDLRVTFPWQLAGVSVAALLLLIVGISCFRNGKRGWGYVFVGMAIMLFLLALYILKQSARVSNTVGGIGGFGGGSSGGGGATGSW